MDHPSEQSPTWTERYGERHRLVRITEFPPGVRGPRKVRLYARREHFVLQWWDPAAKATLSDRVDGDLVAAIVRARQIEERLTEFKSSGQRTRRPLPFRELIDRFLADLEHRADAGEVSPATVRRYRAALRHFQAYCELPAVLRDYPAASRVDRSFRLGLASFLAGRPVARNGKSGSPRVPMAGADLVLDTVRALFAWAADPRRGALIGEPFHNPFLRQPGTRSRPVIDLLGEPDISLPMACALVAACDPYKFRLFVPMLLFGLRAAEPCFLFAEHLVDGWLRVPCIPELNVLTKGRRSKRFPLGDELRPFWSFLKQTRTQGLLYKRRSVVEGRESVPLRGASMAVLIEEYRRRCASAGDEGAANRLRLRDALLHEAGALTYDHLHGEFARLTRPLGWPSAATLKDLRHLFATTMNNAAMPDPYRRYLMGHAPPKGAIHAYTHLDQLPRHFSEALRREWSPLIEAVRLRLRAFTGGDDAGALAEWTCAPALRAA